MGRRPIWEVLPLAAPLPGLPLDLQSESSTISADITTDEHFPKDQSLRLDRVSMTRNRTNLFRAIALSALVLLLWSYFVAPSYSNPYRRPRRKRRPRLRRRPTVQDVPRQSGDRVAIDRLAWRARLRSRAAASTTSCCPSITRPPTRFPPIELLSPSGSPHPFYAEFGWMAPPGRRSNRSRCQMPIH